MAVLGTTAQRLSVARGSRSRSGAGQAYESKEAAKKGITSVQTNAAGADVIDLTAEEQGFW